MIWNSRTKLLAIYFIVINSIIMNATASKPWRGTVDYIVDGDTLHVLPIELDGKSKARKIRIEGIDAPEICQVYGPQSTAALKKLTNSKQITVISKRFDYYGREVARITLNDEDVGSWMVRNGHAWSLHRDGSAGPYRAEEKTAIRARLGLFANSAATEPRIFRRERGSCYSMRAKNGRKPYN